MYSRKRRRIYYKNRISHVEVFDFYDWMCVICGEAIDKAMRFPHGDAATLEHIVPLSRGGEHSWDNVRPAHARCNHAKGDKLLEEYNGA